MTLEEQYIEMYQNIKESRDLLAEKLLHFHLITQEQYENAPFYDLLQCIDPIEMHAYKILDLPNEPIEDPTIPHIESQAELENYLYTNNRSKILTKELSLVDLNYIILKKTLFYREYLKYYLQKMNINSTLLRKAKTIKALIKLLDYVDRKKYTHIDAYVDEELYYQVDNEIYVSVIDDSDNVVIEGKIEIYLNDIFYKKIDVTKSVNIIPWKLGTNTLKIKYIGNDEFFSSQTEEYTFNVVRGYLIPIITLRNTNPNSYYFDIEYEEDEPIEGYSEDTWTLDVNIVNLQGETITREIPFEIYLEDDRHTLIKDTTDSDGTKHYDNITIPYHNSDFINMETHDIESIEVLDQPLEYTNSEILENLTFVTNFKFEDGVIEFETHKFSTNDYLDTLNGCITNIHMHNNYIIWDTFQTNKHIKIESISNIKKEIGHLITNIIYKDNILYVETAQTRQVDIFYVPERDYLNLYVETKLNSSIYNDGDAVYEIGLYYPALEIDDSLLTWYKDSPTQPTQIPIKMIDMYTGQIQSNNDHKLITISNGETTAIKDYFDTPRYNLIPSNSLPYGRTNLTISICTDSPSSITQKINWENVTQLSFYHKSEEFGLINIYIGDDKIASTTTHSNWTLFEYNNIQDLFLDEENYIKDLTIVNVISFTHIYIDNIVAENSNLTNGDFNNGLQYWETKGGVSSSDKGMNDSFCIDIINEKHCNTINKYFDIKSNFEIPEKTIFYYKNAPTIYYKPLGITEENKEIKVYESGQELIRTTEDDGSILLNTEIGEHNITIKGNSDGITEERNYSYEIRKAFNFTNITNSTKEAIYQIEIFDLENEYDIQFLHSNNNITSICQVVSQYIENDTIYITIIIPRNNQTIGNNTIRVMMNSDSKEENFTITVPDTPCVTDINFNNNDDLVVTTINRVNINNTDIVSDIELINNDLKITTKTIEHSYDNIQGVITDISIENDNLKITTYNEDD